MTKPHGCWICGRTNKDIHNEIPDLPKKTSMITKVIGLGGIQFYVCIPCKSILTTVSSRITTQGVMHISNEISEAQKQMDFVEEQVGILNNFFRGKKTKDELRDVT